MIRHKIIQVGFMLMIVTALTTTYFMLRTEDEEITGFLIYEPADITDPDIVVFLTFDDPADPWKDYSMYDHRFDANGNAAQDEDNCKWYGCIDLTDDSGSDFLNGTIEQDFSNGMAVSYWLKLEEQPDKPSQAFYQLGEDTELKWTQENSWGISTSWAAAGGEVIDDSSAHTNSDTWIHYLIQYDNNEMKTWRNGELVDTNPQPMGALNSSKDILLVGRGLYGIDTHGYMDEFMIFKRANFTDDEVLAMYNEKKDGTPPDIDLYVKAIKYELPYDFSDSRNRLKTGTNMPITLTIANKGIMESSSFKWKVVLDGDTVCSGTSQIDALSEHNLTCSWSTESGFHQGFVMLDTGNSNDEDVEENNEQRIYIPFIDRPWFHFTLDEWEGTLKSFCLDDSNDIAYESCSRFRTFVSEDFSDSWSGNSVDPRGKKGRENAMACLLNDYDPNNEQCKRAKNHLLGWSGLDPESYSNVQSIHELAQVGITYDIMFPMLSEAENEQISEGLYNICQRITNLENTRPDLDDDDEIRGGNGFGFGSGMGGFCYSIIGAYPENPTLIQYTEQGYWGKNIPDEWMDRERRYLQAFKDDSWSKFQEGWLYKFYSQFHMVENLWFEKKYGLNDLDSYDNALCSMGRELVTDMLDYSYNGDDLRDDRNRQFRGIQRGDSMSYEDPGSNSLLGWAIADYYALLCDDQDTKDALMYLRDLAKDETSFSIPETYIYGLFADQAHADSPENTFPKAIYDNANDIFTIRTSYSYQDDTVIQIDGGEERGSGHSQAQGYFLYALGEPFLDYEQVPYEDDVRAETWKNGISLQDAEQDTEGVHGTYSQDCGNAPLNQYYGMMDCDAASYLNDYPNYRRFPLEYGGDIEDYIGTEDAEFAGAYVWRPYENADPVREYFVKLGDVLAKRTVVTNNNEGTIYHNFINIADEFTEDRDGTDITFSRGSKNMDILLIDSDKSASLGGGTSSVQYCFSKTSCNPPYQGAGTYRRTYLKANANDWNFILAHHWYLDGQRQKINSIGSQDKGLTFDDKVIVFDSNDDGKTEYDGYETDGWALAIGDNSIGAFNATYIDTGFRLFKSDIPISVFIETGNEITLTANTMTRDPYIDVAKKARVTIDARDIGADLTVQGASIRSESDGKVTFDMTPSQNSGTYTILAGAQRTTPYAYEFDGDTTEFIEGACDSINGLVLEVRDYGKIVFDGTIDATGKDLDSHIQISRRRIEIDTDELPGFDRPARLHFYDIIYEEPLILRDDEECDDCEIISYEGGTLTVDVPGFSEYRVSEGAETEETTTSGGGGSGGTAPAETIVQKEPENQADAKVVYETPEKEVVVEEPAPVRQTSSESEKNYTPRTEPKAEIEEEPIQEESSNFPLLMLILLAFATTAITVVIVMKKR